MVKKIALLALVMGISLLGCKKDKAAPEEEVNASYFMKFKVDGVQKNYSSKDGLSQCALSYNYLDDDRKYISLFLAQREYIKDSDKNSFLITVSDLSPLEVGKTYVNFKNTSSGQIYLSSSLIFSYTDENDVSSHDFGEDFAQIYNANSEGYIKITKVTTDYVKGVFGTKLYNDDYTKNLKITDGEFCLKRLTK